MLLPASLLREVDELVLSGRGSYVTREEFFQEAIQNHVLEVKHGPTEAGQLLLDGRLRGAREATPDATRRPQVAADNAVAPDGGKPGAEQLEPSRDVAATSPDGHVGDISQISQTELRIPRRGFTVANGIARSKKEPLLGLHNRDFPSIWAAHQLADLTPDEPIPAPQFFELATREAWRYAESLLELEKQSKTKLTALFPTNTAKPQSAEEGFRAFAIGTVARKSNADGTFQTTGPLFAWQLAQLVKPNGTLHIGLTEIGYQLLEALDGLTLRWPHEHEYAGRFFDHLQRHAPSDWEGFEQLLRAVADTPTRTELVEFFNSWQPDWSEKTANTNAAGFVARGREWGLVTPKLIDGRYVLTEFGRTTLNGKRTV